MQKSVFILGFLLSCFVMAGDDPVVGEWVSTDSNEASTVLVEKDGNFYHSRYGRGDVEHKNASRYEITVYHDDNGGGMQTCTAIIDFTKDGEMDVKVRPNSNIGTRCDWGRMKRIVKNTPARGLVEDPKGGRN